MAKTPASRALTQPIRPSLASPLPRTSVRLRAYDIRSSRLFLRPLTPPDRPRYIHLVHTSRAALDPHFPLHKPGESDDALFDRQLALTRAGDQTRRAWRRLAVLSDGTPVGCFNLNSVVRGLESTAELTFWIGTPYMRKGLAREGLDAVLAHAFADPPSGLGLDTLTAHVARTNTPSGRLLRSLGLREPYPRHSVEFNLAGRWVAHDMLRIANPAASTARARSVDAFGARIRHSLDLVLRVEQAFCAQLSCARA